jgi:hypothetical protein
LFVLFFFGADFGNFSYNHTRINASALNFAEDPVISFKMLWQSYPMVWILLALILSVVMLSKLFKKTHVIVLKKNTKEDIVFKRKWHVLAIVFLCWSVFGLFSFTPLKWKDAFAFNDNFKSYVALNPLQNFFTTLRFRSPSFDEAKSKQYYPVIADFLQLDSLNSTTNSYERIVEPNRKSLESKPNIS